MFLSDSLQRTRITDFSDFCQCILIWWEGRVRFFQAHCREQESLFLVIIAMHSDLMGRGVWFYQTWASKPLQHNSWVAVATTTDRPKSVHNRCVIEPLVAFLFSCLLACLTFLLIKWLYHRTESDLLVVSFRHICREQGSLFLSDCCYVFWYVMGRMWFFQTHRREQGSLFWVIVAMHSDVMGRWGMALSDTSYRTRITVLSDCCYAFRWDKKGNMVLLREH